MAFKKQYGKKEDNSKENLAELKRRLAEKAPAGVYVFSGDEEYMKR